MRRSTVALAGLAVVATVAAVVFGVLAEGGGKVQAGHGTITATATGSVPAPTAAFPGSVTNGDFLIAPLFPTCTSCPIAGDGDSDRTTWTFDFTTDPNFGVFPTGELTSALLTLTLTRLGEAMSTDQLRIDPPVPLPLIALVDFLTFPDDFPAQGNIGTVQVDLLAFYSSAQIRGEFDPAGQIPMLYFDDATVSFAQLDLETTLPVGGVVELLVGGSDSPASTADGSGSSAALYATIAGAIAAGALAVAAGGWYARRRLS